MSEKMTAKQYAEKLLYTPEYAADKQAEVKAAAAAFAEGYKTFLDAAKTEREAVTVSEKMLKEAGYQLFEEGLRPRRQDLLYPGSQGCGRRHHRHQEL